MGSDCPVDGYPEYPHVPRPVLLLFCAYVLIWYLQIGTRIAFLGAIRIEFLVACVLIPLGIAVHNASKVRLESPLIPLLSLYFLLLFIMTIFSYDFETSWNVFYNRVIKFAFMAFFIVCFVKSPTGLRFFIGAFMLACLKMGQEGLVGQLTGGLVWQNQGVMRLHGATMMYRHPNSFSGMALGTLPFILYLFPVVNKWLKLVLLAQLVLSLNIIVFTGSRTGYIGFIGVALVWFFRTKKKGVILFCLLLFFAVSLKYIPEQYIERFKSIYTTSEVVEQDPSANEALHGGDSSKGKRIQIIKDAISIFLAHPFGVGVSAFPSIRFDKFGRSQDTHNLYLEVATNIGFQGLVLWGFLIIALLKRLNSAIKKIDKLIVRVDNILINIKDNYRYSIGIVEDRKDLVFLKEISNATFLFVVLRLFLGMFGMDLYEIYWWFAVGLSISIDSILLVSSKRVEFVENKQCVTL
jgi:O-antigen ligase